MNARDFALILLDKRRLPGWKANLVREGKPSAPQDPRDWALAEQIVNGVVKNLLCLRGDIEYYSAKSVAGIDPMVQKILAIGLYQMKFLDRIPASAAVDQAVEQTKRFGRRRAAGFVNAVLRNVERQPAPVVPDANADPEGYAERVLSHPRELFRRLAALLGNERALAFCRHDNAEPPTILRLFKGVERADLIGEWERLRDSWKEKGLPELPAVEMVPHEMPGLLVVRGARGAILAHWAKRGLAQVQDVTAAGVVEKMRIVPGMRVLDRCAGLGTKTMQIQERIGTNGEVAAVDASSIPNGRVATIAAGPSHLKRPGCSGIEAIRIGRRNSGLVRSHPCRCSVQQQWRAGTAARSPLSLCGRLSGKSAAGNSRRFAALAGKRRAPGLQHVQRLAGGERVADQPIPVTQSRPRTGRG